MCIRDSFTSSKFSFSVSEYLNVMRTAIVKEVWRVNSIDIMRHDVQKRRATSKNKDKKRNRRKRIYIIIESTMNNVFNYKITSGVM